MKCFKNGSSTVKKIFYIFLLLGGGRVHGPDPKVENSIFYFLNPSPICISDIVKGQHRARGAEVCLDFNIFTHYQTKCMKLFCELFTQNISIPMLPVFQNLRWSINKMTLDIKGTFSLFETVILLLTKHLLKAKSQFRSASLH